MGFSGITFEVTRRRFDVEQIRQRHAARVDRFVIRRGVLVIPRSGLPSVLIEHRACSNYEAGRYATATTLDKELIQDTMV